MIIKNNLNLVSKSNNGLLDKKHKKNNAQEVNFGTEIKLREGYFEDIRNWFIIKNYDKVTGFITSAVSVIGLSVGGLALMFDYSVKKAQGKIKSGNKKHEEKGLSPSTAQANSTDATKSVMQADSAVTKPTENPGASTENTQTPLLAGSAGTTANKYSFLQQLKDEAKQGYESVSFKGNASLEKEEKVEKKQSHEGEFAHFEPVTEFGKMGLNLAKTALVVSGFAGFFTGIALHIPLMSLGEVVANLLAAPIINTGAGYAVMSAGLGLLFLGRAYDGNPVHRANYSIMATKSWPGRAKYIADNMWGCIKDTGKSTIIFGKHLFSLFSPNKQVRKEARHFLRDKVLRVKSSTLTVGQEINAAGMSTVKKGLKSHPYRLQVAAMVLALGGVGVLTADVLRALGITKDDKLKKATFRVAETGQVLDNLGLITYGLERCYKGNPAGFPTIISGATMMWGAPNADNDFGKGLTWFGLSFFFLFLALERLSELCQAFSKRKALKANPKKMIEEATAIIRQFEIDFSKFLPKKYLNYLRKLMGNSESENIFVTIAKMFKPEGKNGKLNMFGKFVEKHEKSLKEDADIAAEAFKVADDKRLHKIPEFLQFLEKELSGEFDPKNGREVLIEKARKAGFAEDYIDSVISISGNPEEVAISNMCADIKAGGWKNYNPEKLLSSSLEYVRNAARYVLDNAEKLLGKNYAQT